MRMKLLFYQIHYLHQLLRMVLLLVAALLLALMGVMGIVADLLREGVRYGHILDPRTGWPASGLESVTVVTDRAIDADGWATALLVMGPEAARELATRRSDLAVVLLERTVAGDLIVWVEERLHSRFAPAPGYTLDVRIF